jgi:hypothetical protein
VCSFQRNAEAIPGMFFYKAGLLCRGKIRSQRCKQFGGHKAVVRPDPIPNSAVKRSLADGSGCIASARVGRRQSFKQNPENILRVFVFQYSNYGDDFNVHTQLSCNRFPSILVLASTWFSPGFNFAFFQTNTQFVAFFASPSETPLTNNSTFFALE